MDRRPTPNPLDGPAAEGRPTDESFTGRRRPTLNASVRRRRGDRAFFIRLAGAIRQNERAIERLKR